ncbi:DUF6249 domain-containing protein [Bacteroides sedimenti]|uniref:DUF6249 domain-containing protein n=1 Tax=Bacteroides sedimenti TaxID=2136147 RepID=A0ABM8IC30_9BACE
MMDFISVPLVVGIVTLGIYKLFELFVRKKERLSIIEKIGEKFDASMIENKFSFPSRIFKNFSFGSLKAGCLLMGVGLGLLVGFIICTSTITGYNMGHDIDWGVRDTAGIVYGASVLIFGGLGLITAFLIEMQYSKKEEK